jgi:hypothetical protein
LASLAKTKIPKEFRCDISIRRSVIPPSGGVKRGNNQVFYFEHCFRHKKYKIGGFRRDYSIGNVIIRGGRMSKIGAMATASGKDVLVAKLLKAKRQKSGGARRRARYWR